MAGAIGEHLLRCLIGDRHSTSVGKIAQACAAEFTGTAVFIFLATGVVLSGCHTENVADLSGSGNTSLIDAAPGSCFINNTSVLLNVALGFGFSLFVALYFASSFSGGHLNPAVSLAMLMARRISLLRCLAYTALQCGGAAVASVILKGLDPNGYKAAAGAANSINAQNGVSYGSALGYEIILTFILILTIFTATDACKAQAAPPLPILAPVAIGVAVFVCHLIGVPIDGMSSLNPARSFGPAVVARQFRGLWLFWLGPCIGAAAGAILYETAFCSREPQQGEAQAEANGEAPDGASQQDIEGAEPIPSSHAQPAGHASLAGLHERHPAEAAA